MENYYREFLASPFRAVVPKKTNRREIESIILFYPQSIQNVLKDLLLIKSLSICLIVIDF